MTNCVDVARERALCLTLGFFGFLLAVNELCDLVGEPCLGGVDALVLVLDELRDFVELHEGQEL